MRPNPNHRRWMRVLPLGLVPVVLLAMLVPFAWAGDDGNDDDDDGRDFATLTYRGECSGRAKIKLKLDREDDRRVEAEVEVDQVQANKRWRVTVFHNGARVAHVLRRADDDGDVDFERHLRNRRGADRISATVRKLPRGQKCTVNGRAPGR